MSEDRITEILSKIKNTVGENNYKLALAITGHRPGKIRDVSMSSKDGELLLEYITQLQNNWNELKRFVEEELKKYQKQLAQATTDLEDKINYTRCFCYRSNLDKMQELENRKV